MNEWLESEEGKSELLKFIDEMKTMSNKKSIQQNPLLAKADNYSADAKNKSKTSYDELILFDEMLSMEINNTSTDPSKNITTERIKQANKKIAEGLQRSHIKDWGTESPKPAQIEEKMIKPPEIEATPKPFDAQRLIERIRRSPNGVHRPPNYELLSCKSQSFLQRLAVLGEMLS